LQNTLRAIIASRELQQSQLSLGSFAIGSLDFHFNIVAREVAPKLIAIVAKFIRHRGQKNPHRHGGSPEGDMLPGPTIA
jgi:hypothetical protein